MNVLNVVLKYRTGDTQLLIADDEGDGLFASTVQPSECREANLFIASDEIPNKSALLFIRLIVSAPIVKKPKDCRQEFIIVDRKQEDLNDGKQDEQLEEKKTETKQD